MQMQIERLAELGLTRREASAYVALLSLGEAKAGQVARLSHEDRTNIYDSLSGLVKKGIASYSVKGNVTYYRAEPPDKLKDFMFEREKALYETLSDLSKIYRAGRVATTVRTFEGKEGLKTVLLDILKEGSELVGFGATDRMVHLFPQFTERYLKERERRGIRSRQLFAEGDPILPCKLTTYRTIPKMYSSPASTVIYGDKVAVLLWFTSPPIAVLIESREAAQAYRNNFEFMWKLAGRQGKKSGRRISVPARKRQLI